MAEKNEALRIDFLKHVPSAITIIALLGALMSILYFVGYFSRIGLSYILILDYRDIIYGLSLWLPITLFPLVVGVFIFKFERITRTKEEIEKMDKIDPLAITHDFLIDKFSRFSYLYIDNAMYILIALFTASWFIPYTLYIIAPLSSVIVVPLLSRLSIEGKHIEMYTLILLLVSTVPLLLGRTHAYTKLETKTYVESDSIKKLTKEKCRILLVTSEKVVCKANEKIIITQMKNISIHTE